MIREGLTFISYSNMPAFIAGIMAAFFYMEGSKKALRSISKPVCRYILIIGTACVMCFTNPVGLGYVNFVSVLFSFLILNLIQQREPLSRFGAMLGWGGKISYGIYIYHPAILILVSFCMARISPVTSGQALWRYFLYLGISYILLLLVSSFSYRYFERLFLRRRIQHSNQSVG